MKKESTAKKVRERLKQAKKLSKRRRKPVSASVHMTDKPNL